MLCMIDLGDIEDISLKNVENVQILKGINTEIKLIKNVVYMESPIVRQQIGMYLTRPATCLIIHMMEHQLLRY